LILSIENTLKPSRKRALRGGVVVASVAISRFRANLSQESRQKRTWKSQRPSERIYARCTCATSISKTLMPDAIAERSSPKKRIQCQLRIAGAFNLLGGLGRMSAGGHFEDRNLAGRPNAAPTEILDA
jgi:hypothetical protein